MHSANTRYFGKVKVIRVPRLNCSRRGRELLRAQPDNLFAGVERGSENQRASLLVFG
jgi:hypothetical protein